MVITIVDRDLLLPDSPNIPLNKDPDLHASMYNSI